VLLSLCATAQPFTNTVIFLENQKPGTTSWLLTNPTPSSGGIEGYASATSVTRGESLNFFVNTTNTAYILEVYRVGWYGGAGARQVFGPVVVPGTVQAMPPIQPDTLLVECSWTNPFTLMVTNNPLDPTDWASGAYVAKLTGLEDGYQSYIIFAVRDDERASDLLAQMSFSTYEAYNPWGGTSLYGTVVVPTAAKKVSFNRPFGRWQVISSRQQWTGSGDFFASHDVGQAGWECNLVRWLEREGYDVTYCTSLDVHVRTNLLLNHKSFISMGHDEYWSYPMRMNVQGARDQGVNLAFLAAGISFWQVRFEPSTVDGTPNRTMVCYRSALLDPVASTSSNYLTTVQWRLPPASLPEHLMVGIGFTTWSLDADLVVNDPNHWVFANTGLQAGQRLIGLLGWEVDKVDSLSPIGIEIACKSPFTDPKAPLGPTVSYSHATSYQAPSGATVFASGSFQWSWGLDDFNVPSLRSSRQNPLVQHMTRNVLARMLNNPIPSSTFFSRTELSTRGNWLPHFGIEGYLLPGTSTNMPPFATLDDGGTPVMSYLTNSPDTNALQQPGGGGRFLAGWSSPTNFTIDLNLTDGQNHQVALYFWDWNNAGRSQSVDVVDAATTNLLDHRSLNGFTNGQWWVWQVNGHVQFQIGAVAGPDCLLNALMLGNGSQAGFVCVDAATQGNWRTHYGADGVFIAGHTPQPPSYAALSVSDGVTTNWSLGTLDVRAPVQGLGSNCLFGAWKANGFFANVLNLNVTDNAWHQLALYCVDSDLLGRQQVVSLVDPATHIVLDSRVLSDFGEGKYLVWNFRGPLEVHLLSLNRKPAVISALFLGPPDSAPSVTLTAPGDGQSFALPTNIVFTTTVSDPQDFVKQVSFYANGNLLASVTNAPFTWTWTNPPLGAYSLTAVALDNFNLSATSASASIYVTTGPDYQPPTIQVSFPPDGALMAGPTNMLLSASANPGSAAIVNVQFLVDGTPTGPLLTNEPFTMSSGNWFVGTHSICASATDAFGVMAFSATNVATVSPVQASAVFRQFDFLPRGNWPGIYGSQGYSMAGVATQLPAFVQVQQSETAWLQWAAFVSDQRALLQPESTLRFARTWYSFTNLIFDVNLLDGQTHRVSLYCLDWSDEQGTQTIYVSDATSAQVLDSRALVGFSNGVYAVWDVTGHVQFSLARYPSVFPAIVNGLFIDPPLTEPTVNLLSPTNGARFGQHDTIPFTALASSGTVPLNRVEFLVDGAIIGTNSIGPPYTLTWSNLFPSQHAVAARAVDVLGSNTLSAPVLVSVERLSSAGLMTVDETQQGNWLGVSGQQGYVIAGDATNFPPYGVANLDAQLVVWSTNTGEARALQSASGTNRVAAAWYSFTNLLVDISFTDYAYHRLGLYFLDWPGFGAVQQIDLLDNRTGTVLDSRTVGAFTNGVMYVWDVVGHLTIQVRAVNGQPALLSGIFFDPSERAPAVNILAPANGAVFYVPTDIQIVADAGPDPAVERLDFFAYGVPLGSSFSGPPYILNWSNVPPGVYSLTATAICPFGDTNSAPVGITVIRRSVIAFTNFAALGGSLQLQGTGPPDTAFVLEGATNLDEGASWMPLLTNAPGDGLFSFQLFDPTNYPQRFYRARVVP
jgi:hypothetical protein